VAVVFKTDAQPVDLPSELLRSAWYYWAELRRSADVPPAAAIDPARLPKSLMPYISIVAVEENPQRFLLRLIGDAGIVATGHNHTGRHVDELPDGPAMTERLNLCVSSRRPYFFEGPMAFAEKTFRTYRTLVMPFTDGSGKVARLLNATEYLDP